MTLGTIFFRFACTFFVSSRFTSGVAPSLRRTMFSAVHPAQNRLVRQLGGDSSRQIIRVSWLFAGLMLLQTLSLAIFGTGRWGGGLAESLVVVGNAIAVVCAWRTFRRAHGVASIFWFLFGVILLIWLAPSTLHACGRLLAQDLVSDSTWRLLYCLYGAPILMILFLPDISGQPRANSEIFLDLFQISIVVALIYSTFFFLPANGMAPSEAFVRNLNLSDAQSVFLLVAVLVRLRLTRAPSARSLLRRFGLFLFVCAVATIVSDLIDLHHYLAAAAWFNLVWTLNQATPALIALTWTPHPEPEVVAPPKFFTFLGMNLALVAIMVTVNFLMDSWEEAHGALLTDIAIAASLTAFTVRLALTQYHQQQEIVHRKAAQDQVAASNEIVRRLLEDSRRQTAEITQISEIGSLLQACSSREEVFRLLPERMHRLFPDAVGSIFLLNASRNRVDTVAHWGSDAVSSLATPGDCWALRRGAVHIHARGPSPSRCSHFLGEGDSLCIPLFAGGEAIGILALQDSFAASTLESDPRSDRMARRLQLARSAAEHVALAIANLGLRESLRVQAVRDPLTGLYNRRYMQEFLEHELHAARRKQRPVAVLMLDLDHFKRFNDTFGHSAGDRMLAGVAEIFLRSVRADDVACRYGGEEFTLILPECSLQQALARAEDIRLRVAENRQLHEGPSVKPVTVSIGVAAFPETTDRVDLLLKLADEALYRAKRDGRNRVAQARGPYASSDSPTQNSAAATSSSS